MRIFITGGTGFFGKSLMNQCPELLDHDVVILSRDPQRRMKECQGFGKNPRLTFLHGDIRDFSFPKPDFDYIFHGATTSGHIIPDEEMRSVVMDGTNRVLEFAGRNQQLKNLLFISSGAVYGDAYNVPMDESFSTEPVSVYGRAKLAAENRCLDSKVPCSIARCFAFVGEFLPLDAHFAIGNFMRDCLNDQPIVIKGDGSPIRTYLYSADLVRWLWTILRRGEPGRAYNVGSAREISIADLAMTVRRVADRHNAIEILKPPTDRPSQSYTPHLGRARRELGLGEETSLEEAIRLTLSHHGRHL